MDSKKVNLNEVLPEKDDQPARPEVNCEHAYSKEMGQEYPRKCVNCGQPEN